MAPLNPNAPFYFPWHYHSCYSSVPSPPPPFPFYFNHSPPPPPPPPPAAPFTATAAAFFYSYSSLPNASNQCYYEAPVYTVQSQVRTKQWMSLPAASGFEGRQEAGLQFPTTEKYEYDHIVENKGDESYAEFCYPKAVMKGGDDNNSTNYSDLFSLRRVWIPKLRWQNRMFALPAADAFEFKDDDVEDEDRTTVMMKNLPNKLMRNNLLELLDKHCCQENQKIKEDGGDGHDSVLSEFDFLYLPMDFDGSNLGYAFVNFTSAVAARRLHRAYQNKAWGTVLGSRKICEVTYARIQGLLPLQRRFKNSIFICDSDDYLPVYFTPSRNGDRHCQTEEHFIGRRVSRT